MSCKQSKLWKTLLIIAVVSMLWIGFFGWNDAPAPPVVDGAELRTYSLTHVAPGTNLFTNHVDGYSLSIPADLAVDMKSASVRAVLERDDLRIELYKQPVGEAAGFSENTYIAYSNQAIEDGPFVIHDKGIVGWLEKNATYLLWSRDVLKHVENDRNHYASIDITMADHDYVYTLLFKSSKPLISGESRANFALKYLQDFVLEAVTESPYTAVRGAEPREIRDVKTKAVYENLFSVNAPLSWGIFQPDAPLAFSALHRLEETLAFEFPLVLYYTGFIEGSMAHPRLEKALKNAKTENRILELTLQTYPTESMGSMIYDILDGAYDEFLYHYAKTVAESGQPVLFRPGNEMNGDWCAYSALHTGKDTEIFVAFYRHIFQVFDAAGADNVIWVWNPNGTSFPDFKWNHALCYYPGDALVDVVGLTAYNTGTHYDGEQWTSFRALYDELYQWNCSVFSQPLMITEFASSSVGGDKVAWVSDMFSAISEMDRIKVALWWDSCDFDADGNVARPYFIDEPPEVVSVFADYFAGRGEK